MNDPILDAVQQLTRRVRWKRGLVMLHQLLLGGVLFWLLLFLVDAALGLNVLGLRIASVGLALFIALGLAVGWATTWFSRIDPVGTAQLLERHFPTLAERIVTLVQLQREPNRPDDVFVPMLRAETTRRLASFSIVDACPFDPERRLWTRATILVSVCVALLFTPSFSTFGQRFVSAWGTPLTPYRIELVQGNGHVLRGESYTIEAQVHVVDPFAQSPSECLWLTESKNGAPTTQPMKAIGAGRFTLVHDDVQASIQGKVIVGAVCSASVEIGVVSAPVLTRPPSARVTSPAYVKSDPKFIDLHESATKSSVLQYSRFAFRFDLDRAPAAASLVISTKTGAVSRRLPLSCNAAGMVQGEEFAIECGDFQAELVLTLEHGVVAKLPVGRWSVHADKAPRFSALRFHGSATPLQPSQVHWITPDDALRLQTEVTDEEGLAGVAIEFRVNDKQLPIKPWLPAAGSEPLKIDQWLPLPQGLNKGDHVQFRLHASDRRNLRQGEIFAHAGVRQPPENLMPQITIVPAPTPGDEGWIHLRIDGAREAFVKQQAQAQRDEMRKVIDDIKKKLTDESQQAAELGRVIHQQAVLTPERRREADKLRILNHQIVEDLIQAGGNPDLARLASQFFNIAEKEMKQSADALKRFSEPDRSLTDSKMELDEVQKALQQAHKKLDQMLQWNDQLAQDRLDQAQIENLAKRQQDLKDQLEKLRAGDPPSEADLAKQIEAIRQEQARLNAEVEDLHKKNKLVQESLAALEQKRAERLADTAQKLVAEQRSMRELPPEKISPEGKDHLEQLAKRQLALTERVEPYAGKNDGPDVSPARVAAQSLRKLLIEDAIGQQKSHEKRLLAWLAKLLPAGQKREDLKDAVLRARVDQVERFGGEQEKIRLDTERLLADQQKAIAAKEGQALREKTQALAKELLKLAQEATNPEAKAMAKEGAEAAAMAEKAMQASADAKANGNAEPAKMLDEDAGKQLELAAKMLQKFTQDDAAKSMAKENSEKTAEALQQSSEQMKIAEAKLPNLTKDAQNAMQAAAEKLAEAANQANKLSTARLPSAAKSPAAQANSTSSRAAGPLPKDFKLEPLTGKSWGELPGQLKTELIQDYRNRFGDEYAELIQQYFERLARTPAPLRKE